MYEMKEVLEEIKFLDLSRMTFKQFYQKLNDAVNSSRNQSIWQLSKIITRYQLDL